jgi:thiol-disulfide isomerase/thioredoxin
LNVAAALLAVCSVFAASDGIAAPLTVETFDATTWTHMQQELPRPAIVVFTATYCASCPALLEHISNKLQERGLKTLIVAVVIDEADKRELLTSEHYGLASRLLVFDGNEASLRYDVDPRWRGITPYVALLPARGKSVFVSGTPTDEQLSAWSRK